MKGLNVTLTMANECELFRCLRVGLGDRFEEITYSCFVDDIMFFFEPKRGALLHIMCFDGLSNSVRT